jgi:hypothetical protein
MHLVEIAKPYYAPAEIASLMQDSGYRADMTKLDNGCTAILSSAAGFNFSIYLYGDCERERVTTLQFSSAFGDKVSVEQVNKWNREKRFLKAYMDAEGELCVEWDVVVSFVSPAAIRECLGWWEAVLGEVNEL